MLVSDGRRMFESSVNKISVPSVGLLGSDIVHLDIDASRQLIFFILNIE
jgi:hypothetical protein